MLVGLGLEGNRSSSHGSKRSLTWLPLEISCSEWPMRAMTLIDATRGPSRFAGPCTPGSSIYLAWTICMELRCRPHHVLNLDPWMKWFLGVQSNDFLRRKIYYHAGLPNIRSLCNEGHIANMRWPARLLPRMCYFLWEEKYIIISLLWHQQGLEVEEDHNLTNST